VVGYEWTIEAVDEYGDIQDNDHRDSLKKSRESAEFFKSQGWSKVEIGLVRNVGDDVDGLQDRQWAYLEDDKLPIKFDGGAKVPVRFLQEANR
jgi:hypothetical protein